MTNSKNKFFITFAVLAIGTSSLAYAESSTAYDTGSESKTLEQNWEETKDAVSEAADDISNATQETYDSIKSNIFNEDGKLQISDMNIKQSDLATNIIGQPVYNIDDERVAKISDIILNRDGEAIMVILADGDFTGLGKHVAYDFNVLLDQKEDGAVIANLTEEMIDNAAAFSYDRSDYNENIRVIPSNGFSVEQLLGADLIDQDGQTMADVENVYFASGAANQVIVKFNDTLGFGGEQTALSYNDLTVTRIDDSLHFKLNAEQAAEFRAYKEVIEE